MTVVKLPQVRRFEHLKRRIEEFRSEFLLFANAVREIRLRVVGEGERFETRHVSRDLGEGRFRLERPDGDNEEWYVADRMHPPSAEARAEVGEAVARDSVKVTAAVPVRFGRLKTGEFWSYFPLQDRTSASALFNAPWSMNDDRTTLLENTYNREILVTLSEMFVEILPKLSTVDDPAGHLDYMPARGREAHSFGDEILCSHVPRRASTSELIPNATGQLCMPTELRPLDLAVTTASERDYEEWSRSPNTGDDVPHSRCYANAQRIARLRQLYVHRYSQFALDQRGRDEMRALARMPKRGVQSWLREWAEGDDLTSAVSALDFVLNNPRVEGIRSAKVVPTTDGMRAVRDKTDVYLQRVDDVVLERGSFVRPGFLAIPGVERKLRELGFRDLDPLAILRARLDKLTPAAEATELESFWDAVLGVPVVQAQTEVARAASDGRVKVPTLDGGWSLPGHVLDIEGIGNRSPERLLDRNRCFPQVAYAAGVVHAPVSSYSIEDEVYFADYCQEVKEDLNRRLGPGERPIDRIELDRGEGPGPFSVLLMLEEAGAPDQVRETWTNELLQRDQTAYWTCEDLDTGQTQRVMSPVRWAVQRAGRLRTNRGYRKPEQVVSAALVEYAALLPLFSGPRPVEAALSLPKDLEKVPATVLREALEAAAFPQPVKGAVLTTFVVTAARVAFPQGHPRSIPAWVGRTVESKRPDTVYVATTDEQESFLRGRQKPYLRADPQQVSPLVDAVGCRRFEDSFSFSLLVEGRHDEERVIDWYTGLRSTFAADKVTNATVVRAVRIVKRVTTEDGVEDQSLESHPDGLTLVVRADLDDRRILSELNEAFQLRLSNADLKRILQEGYDQRLEGQRQAARAAATDAERLEVFFGPDTLRENLPKGLWEALEAQELVDGSTSVAELFLTVYGSDSIRFLAGEFKAEGYTDVPEEWAGRTPTIDWLRKMGFGVKYAGRRNQRQDNEFVVPGAVKLNPLHDFQKHISRQLEDVLTLQEPNGRALKGLVELPTGAGKTRVATQTVLRLFTEGRMSGTVLWIAQSAELCEQAVQTFKTVWRGLSDERPLTIGRLWDNSTVHEPDTQFSVIVATDAKLDESVVDSPRTLGFGRPRPSLSTRRTVLADHLDIPAFCDGSGWTAAAGNGRLLACRQRLSRETSRKANKQGN
ncbi:DEAD/DEAH box helicase family protein [Streptomyces sp. MAR4 CNX-425]|uniref:DEAD/DEAH box helicase family protein n=1 Tax=Streptomyces sp. MAR4 CNX-425 TaxID=3406343 RepID=UPI003B50C195